MPRAIVLNTASKANLTGGTFADSLTANAGDSLSVANYNGDANTPGGRILEAWAGDSDSVCEIQVFYTRPEATHDQSHGFRAEIPGIALGGAATNAAFNLLPGYGTIDLYKSDTPTVQVSGTAGDDVLYSWVTEYDDLPGASAVMGSWAQIQQLQVSAVGIQVTAVASATAGAYGAQRAFNADDDRLHANTWYAILGASVQTQVSTISMLGPDWGGQRIGFPAGSLDLRSNTWFVDQSVKWQKSLIPCFNSNNKGNVLVQVADLEASTSPKIDFFLYELSSQPGG
jgi:hypothetical protein